MKSKEDRLGFPPGVALKMLTSVFQQYDALTRRDDKLREAKSEKQGKELSQDTIAGNKPAPVKQQRTATESIQQSSTDNMMAESVTEQLQQDSATAHGDSAVKQDSDKSAKSESQHSIDTEDKIVHNKSDAIKVESKDTKTKSEEDDDPELTRQQQKFQENPESYNGAVRENYSWAQSITDLDLRVKVPSYIRKGRDVKVDISKKHVKVAHKDESGQYKVVIDGDLTWEVHKDESMWTLNPGENVHINFEKKEERWWEAVLTDEPKINVRKIDASRPMTDLDDEAQAKIEEMMYNDRQKKMGLPTAKEQKMQDMLKNAWDAEGSPFKGQPFDPSKFSMDSSGVVNMKPS
ncbi:nudC domain-containing protein 3-like isoform X2 [Mercenaria mercenaria]|nr:nudC domain-containing protein 3-like isoform X2 [Mercenaria mercenaria]